MLLVFAVYFINILLTLYYVLLDNL